MTVVSLITSTVGAIGVDAESEEVVDVAAEVNAESGGVAEGAEEVVLVAEDDVVGRNAAGPAASVCESLDDLV